ncbi:MAG TPA: ribosome silencing factor [Firmicutes bacterium]|nr:ribosome silencing factor [Bacillota bacterium]HOQ24680.1 ribosome silencing factor [Bacillota bacterium]HPT68268.1 ribosome silencing factor [Bacillota bacterium]
MTDLEYLHLAWEAVLDKKGREPVLLDLRELSRVTDYFLIASADTAVQVKAIADRVEELLLDKGLAPLRREGYQQGYWVLLDYGFLVVHILRQPERDFYRLEHLWQDAKPVNLPL